MDDYLRAQGGIFASIIEEDSSAGVTYVAEAKTTAAAATSAVWRVKRIKTTESGGVKRTAVAWAGGTAAFKFAANSMSSLSFADY